MPDADRIEPVCPYARKIGGATPRDGGVICTVMERDAQRADPILEGAPVGVYVKWADDPSILANLCYGQGEPLTNPDELATRDFGDGHYSGCPIYCAGREVEFATAEGKRAFGAPEQPDLQDESSLGDAVTMDDFEIEMG